MDIETNKMNDASVIKGCLAASASMIGKTSGKIIQEAGEEKLSSLGIGQKAEIMGISSDCRGEQRRRLMDLGFIPGSEIVALIKSASGDPVGYRIKETTIGIRKSQADMIFIRKALKNGNECSK